MKGSCPYCGVILDKLPKQSKECNECGNTYYIRKTYLFKTKILTKYQSDSSDFFDKLRCFGATIDDYIDTGKMLEAKWSRKPSYSDVLWNLSNSGLIERGMRTYGRQESLNIIAKAKKLTKYQAEYQLSLGNDPKILLAIINSYDIEYECFLRESDKLYFEIMAAECCDECLEQNGRVYSAADIEDNEFIPSKLCTHKLQPSDKYSWCVCKYLVRI